MLLTFFKLFMLYEMKYNVIILKLPVIWLSYQTVLKMNCNVLTFQEMSSLQRQCIGPSIFLSKTKFIYVWSLCKENLIIHFRIVILLKAHFNKIQQVEKHVRELCFDLALECTGTSRSFFLHNQKAHPLRYNYDTQCTHNRHLDFFQNCHKCLNLKNENCFAI